VQSAIDEDLIGPDTVIVPVDCPICNRPHLIDPSEELRRIGRLSWQPL
jgi:hypothetical protein